MRNRYFVAALTVVVIALIVAGANLTTSPKPTAMKTNKGKEYLIPGSPKLPTMGKDWFESGIEGAENPSLTEVKNRVCYSFLLRSSGTEPMQPIRVFVQPQLVQVGPSEEPKEVEGFSFRYNDRIQLLVDPTSRPLEVEALLDREQSPNTEGVTKPYFKTIVRNFTAVAREAGVQKWEDGTENRYPASIQWTEPSDGDTPYLLYTLLGDCSVDDLKQIANSLLRAQESQTK